MPLSIEIAYFANALECCFLYPLNALMKTLANSSKVVMVMSTDHFFAPCIANSLVSLCNLAKSCASKKIILHIIYSLTLHIQITLN